MKKKQRTAGVAWINCEGMLYTLRSLLHPLVSEWGYIENNDGGMHSQHLLEGQVLLYRRVAHVQHCVPSALGAAHHIFQPLHFCDRRINVRKKELAAPIL